MRMLFLLRDLSRNGIKTYTATLAAALRGAGHDVRIWPSDRELDCRQRARVPMLHPWLAPWMLWRLRPWHPEVVIVNHYTQAKVAAWLHRHCGLPWLAVMHNGHAWGRMLEWAALLPSAAGVVTMSGELAAQYARLVSDHVTGPRRPMLLQSRLPVVLPSVAAERPPHDRLCLAYCSRLSGLKGPRCETWLRAVACLPDATACRLLVIGGGSRLPTLRRVAGDLNLAVEFTGTVTGVSALLAQVDVLTGAGYALIEGLAAGCVGVGLGFGGCVGAITPDNFDAACAANFGDHYREDAPYPGDAAAVRDALEHALALMGTLASEVVRERVAKTFAPAPIARQFADFATRALQAA